MEVASVQSTSQEEEQRNNFNNQVDEPEASSSSNINAVSSNYQYDEEDEEDICRICRNPGDSENPLRYPCACKGSMKFVHQGCLLRWLAHSKSRYCEVCKHVFSFSLIYAENAPARLPFAEFVVGIAKKACHVLQFFVRHAVGLSIWFLIVPFITFWMWRLAFVRSLGEVERLFLRIFDTHILACCFYGFLLDFGHMVIVVGVSFLRNYFRHLRELGVHDAGRGNEGERNGARAARGPPAPANRIHVVDENGEDAGAGQGIADGGQANAVVYIARNMMFIGVVVFVPFSLGRIILHFISWYYGFHSLSSATSSMLSTFMSITESALYFVKFSLMNSLSITNLSSEIQKDGLLSHPVEVIAETLNANTTGLEVSNSVGKPLSVDPSSSLSDFTTLATGYFFIVSLVVLYLRVIAFIRYIRGDALIGGRFYAIASIADAISSLIRQFLIAMRPFVPVMKVAFLLVIELVGLPLIYGWLLDFCTTELLGRTVSERVEFFSNSPLASSLIHWIVGTLFQLKINIFFRLLQEVLHHGVLYFIRDRDDPNDDFVGDLINHPMLEQACRVLRKFAGYGILTVLVVFLPVKLAMRLAPSIFPLDITTSDPFTEIPAAMLLLWICWPFIVKHTKLRITIKALLRGWFTAVGCALCLTEFLLPRTEDTGGQQNVNVERWQDRLLDVQRHGALQQDQAPIAIIVAGYPYRNTRTSGNVDVVEEYDGDEAGSDLSRYCFLFRIVLLLVLTWMALLLFNSALIVVPISFGRALFNSIPLLPIIHGIKCNDVYAIIIGSYAIFTILAGARYIFEHVKAGRAQVLFCEILEWFGIVLKSSALLLIWILVLPVLIGLLVELLVIVPMRVPVDENPVFLLYQDWALGLFFLYFWTRLVMLDHRMALADISWQIKFMRVKENGFSRLQAFWVLQEILIPIITKLLTALCVPCVFARGVFPVLGCPLIVNSVVYRFAWVGCLTVMLLCSCAQRFPVWFTSIHNYLRDERYLISLQLHDFDEERVARRNDTA